MRTFLVLMLIAILGALAGAGFFMLRKRDAQDGPGRDHAMARALAVRVALSVAAFLLVLLAWWMGWIKPTGIPMSA
ncbi:MAG: hypothetical protein RLZ83_1561 [Pseudomonadota bacterium]|jgi:hypothetical protein